MASFGEFEMTSITGDPIVLSKFDGQVCFQQPVITLNDV